MADAARADPTTSLRRHSVIEAVAYAAEQLLRVTAWREVADDVLGRLGDAAGVSRVSLTENSRDADGRLRYTLVAEWCAPGIEPMLGNPIVTGSLWEDGFSRWIPLMRAGEPIVDDVADLPASERRVLAAHDIVSLAYLPVSVDGDWWGCVGFDDCRGAEAWSDTDLDALRTAATLLGAAIVREHQESQLRDAEARYRGVVENIPAVTYLDVPTRVSEGPGARASFVSPQAQDMLGYPAERFVEDPDFWFSIMHPNDLARLDGAGAFDVNDATPFDEEYRMRHADGRWIWVHDSSTAIFDEKGEIAYFQGFMTDVTQRRKTEDRLRRARARLQALIDHIPAVVYTESPDTDPKKFFISSQVESIFGYSAHEWTWTAGFWMERIHPQDRAAVQEADRRRNEDAEPLEIDYRFRRADGAYVWVHDQAVFVATEDDDGFWQGMLFDITERKEAEERLRAAEQVLRATVEHLPAIVYRESPTRDTEPLYISPQVSQVLGYEPGEWTGTRGFWVDHLHPDDRSAVLDANARADQTREPFAIDYRFRTADGSYVWLHDEATFVEDAGGKPFWQGFIQDISEAKEAELSLREAEAKFRRIVEQNPAVFYTQEFDPSDPSVSRTTYVSPTQDTLFGFTSEEILADPTLWARLVHPDDRDAVLAADIASNRSQQEEFSLEYRMMTRDGRAVWVQDTAQLIRVPGRPPFWQGFLLDITERKEAQGQLERALEVERDAAHRLRSLDEMKNTFLQAVSHDLRTPLAAILGLAVTLERGDVELTETDGRDLAGRIAQNARRLDRLVTNLLDLDRLSRGILTPKLRKTDLGALIERVLTETDFVSEERLRTDIGSVTVRADAAKVERIVENLLSNTVRHTPETSTIWISAQPVEDGALIVVDDDGPGVAAEHREAIFEPFQQGPDAPQHSPGVGVGLALVRRFAELHDGRAWVEEREGGGASFRVFLPSSPGGVSPN